MCYISGSRADFGHVESTLTRAHRSGALDISVCVTGMHLLPSFGLTVRDIEASALRITARIPVPLEDSTGASMAKGIGRELIGITEALERERPDLTLVLGDRGEMLAGALASIHLGIPIVHLHGGERSGTVDEPIRHAISKLAHYHFVATDKSRERLIHMGELPAHVFVTGAPGLEGLEKLVSRTRDELCRALGLDPLRPLALVVFHPVLQEADQAGKQMNELLRAVLSNGLQAVCLSPNADSGGIAVKRVLDGYKRHSAIRLVVHLPRAEFVSWMAAADVMVGNSSSGIIEAASFGLPVVNVGSRQRLRERSPNTIDTEAEEALIAEAISSCLKNGRGPGVNVYRGENAVQRIIDLLTMIPLDPSVLQKVNAY
ncbi:MAG TPA: UDP-N-acetylglucosamine 2-epimerase [Burkholderiales bacterium]|nr:UDP-N-acetylglucosamine 2-epimerase [Burkholderiales bacterium]